MDNDLALALALADVADQVALARFRAQDLRVETKPDRTPVTEADIAVERAIWRHLADHRPQDATFGEETGASGVSDGRCWIVDPIDATANYLRGVPVWATLISLVIDGGPVIGVASAPAMGRRWWASEAGAWTSDVDGTIRPLAVSGVTQMADASVSTSDANGWDDYRPGSLQRLLTGVWRTRSFGDFWSHLLVAEGAVDIGAEPALAPWDVAALIPIVQRAGGQLLGLNGGPALLATGDGFTVPAGALSTNTHLTSDALDRIAG